MSYSLVKELIGGFVVIVGVVVAFVGVLAISAAILFGFGFGLLLIGVEILDPGSGFETWRQLSKPVQVWIMLSFPVGFALALTPSEPY